MCVFVSSVKSLGTSLKFSLTSEVHQVANMLCLRVTGTLEFGVSAENHRQRRVFCQVNLKSAWTFDRMWERRKVTVLFS